MKGKHGVEAEELDKTLYKLVVGNHLHKVLALGLALSLEHAGGKGGTGEVGLDVTHKTRAGRVVPTEEGEGLQEDLAQLRSIHAHCLIVRPPLHRSLL